MRKNHIFSAQVKLERNVEKEFAKFSLARTYCSSLASSDGL